MSDAEPLIIVGSSVRAAAQSAVRAGFSPWCIDQFGDRDLADIAAGSHVVQDWPDGIESAIESAPRTEWIYTGALENQPELISWLLRRRVLRGCEPDALARLRDPFWLAATLAAASISTLPLRLPAGPVSDVSEWLLKPLASAAGIGVRELRRDGFDAAGLSGHYLQRRVAGRVISGLYLADVNSVQLIGLSEQHCRGIDAREHRYVYSGSQGPLTLNDLSADVFAQAQRIGSVIQRGLISEGTRINGLFGIDFVRDERTGELWMLEVNPRYTASAELYEAAPGCPLIRWHIDACRGLEVETSRPPYGRSSADGSRSFGKLIVYAEREFTAPDLKSLVQRTIATDDSSQADNGAAGEIRIADIPREGTLIRRDEPVCTLLTSSPDLSTCYDRLACASRQLLTSIDAVAE